MQPNDKRIFPNFPSSHLFTYNFNNTLAKRSIIDTRGWPIQYVQEKLHCAQVTGSKSPIFHYHVVTGLLLQVPCGKQSYLNLDLHDTGHKMHINQLI